MKRILFVDHVSRILGGAEINLLELLAAARPAGKWETAVACPPDSHLGEALKRLEVRQFNHAFPAEVNELRVMGRSFPPLRSLRTWRAVRAAAKNLEHVIRDFSPHAVISCTNKDHFCVSAIAATRRPPAIWWVNDIISRDFFPWIARNVFCRRARQARRLVVVSDFARAALIQEGLPAALVTTVHNGIPLDRYVRGDRDWWRREQGLPLDEPVIGIAGRLTPWKGQDFFLRLAQAWIRKNARGHFVLIGRAFNEDQAYETALHRFVTENNLARRAHFIPFQNDIAAALGGLDVLVHASTRPEPFGRVIIEAMAVGVPVLGARGGGVPEIITEGVNGLLATPGHLPDYLGQLEKLIGSSALAASLAAAGRRTVESKFTVELVRAGLEQIVEEAG